SVGTFLPETVPLLGGAVSPAAIAALPTVALAALRSTAGAELLLSEDATATMLVVQPRGDPIEAVRAIRAAELPEGSAITLAGNPVVYAEVLDLLGWFLLAIPPIVFVLLFAVFTAT